MALKVALGLLLGFLILLAVRRWSQLRTHDFITGVGMSLVDVRSGEYASVPEVEVVGQVVEATTQAGHFLFVPSWSPLKRWRSAQILGYAAGSHGWSTCETECIDVIGETVIFSDARRGINVDHVAVEAMVRVSRRLVAEGSARRVQLWTSQHRFHAQLWGGDTSACCVALLDLAIELLAKQPAVKGP